MKIIVVLSVFCVITVIAHQPNESRGAELRFRETSRLESRARAVRDVTSRMAGYGGASRLDAQLPRELVYREARMDRASSFDALARARRDVENREKAKFLDFRRENRLKSVRSRHFPCVNTQTRSRILGES